MDYMDVGECIQNSFAHTVMVIDGKTRLLKIDKNLRWTSLEFSVAFLLCLSSQLHIWSCASIYGQPTFLFGRDPPTDIK